MLTAQISKMRSFLIVRKICAESADHHIYKCAITHVGPVGTAHKLTGCIPRKWTVDI